VAAALAAGGDEELAAGPRAPMAGLAGEARRRLAARGRGRRGALDGGAPLRRVFGQGERQEGRHQPGGRPGACAAIDVEGRRRTRLAQDALARLGAAFLADEVGPESRARRRRIASRGLAEAGPETLARDERERRRRESGAGEETITTH